jgi:hypothetical protein
MRADFYRALQFSCPTIRRSLSVMILSRGRTIDAFPQVMAGMRGIANR